jgi:hypothetical protein
MLTRLWIGAAISALLISVSISLAQESRIGFKGAGFRAGIVNPEGDWKPTAEYGLTSDLGSPLDNLFLEGSLSYWSSVLDYPFDAGYTLKLSDLAFRTAAKYHFTTGAGSPYAGGGLAYHFYGVTLETPAGVASSYWDNYLQDDEGVLFLLGGYEYMFNPNVIGSVEARYDLGSLSQTALQFSLTYMVGR